MLGSYISHWGNGDDVEIGIGCNYTAFVSATYDKDGCQNQTQLFNLQPYQWCDPTIKVHDQCADWGFLSTEAKNVGGKVNFGTLQFYLYYPVEYQVFATAGTTFQISIGKWEQTLDIEIWASNIINVEDRGFFYVTALSLF
jgi:hypothetical protein